MRPRIFEEDDDEPQAAPAGAGRGVVRPAPRLDAAAAQQLQAAKDAGLLADFDSFLDARAPLPAPLPAHLAAAAPPSAAPPPSSHYIGAMVQKAAERKRVQDSVLERRLAREQEAEEAQYGVKERFVTAAYAAKQEAQQRDAALAAQQAAEEEAALASRRGLTGLYQHVLFAGAGGSLAPPPQQQQQQSPQPQQPSLAASGGGSTSASPPAQQQAQQALPPRPAAGASGAVADALPAPLPPPVPSAPVGFQGSTPEEVEQARIAAVARFEARKAAGLL